MRRALAFLLTLIAVAVPFGPADAAETYTPIPTLPEAARTRLLRYIASDDTDAFLADSLFVPRLEHLLGAELSHLRQNIDVRGSVAYSSGMVYVTGNAPHHGGEEHGFVGIETYSGRICAAVYSRGRFDVYGAGTDRHGIPVALREWILGTWAYVSLDGSIPSTVTLVGKAPNR
jgi:hypothetical protein